MQPESIKYLRDVQRAGELIAQFVHGVEEADYLRDEMRRSAVERQLEIIGEALNAFRRKDANAAEEIPDLPRIVAMRNVIAHRYAVVNHRIVWQAATVHVPKLVKLTAELLVSAGYSDTALSD